MWEMKTLMQFSEKENDYHEYQARQNFLRQQRTMQKELENALADRAAYADREAKAVEREKASEAEKEQMRAEIAQLKAQIAQQGKAH